MFGELSRMTQFKDKSRLHSDNINAGLFTYPVLMAADILLYQTDLVPTGQDQKQHIELARDIANRFNSVYSPTFATPEPYIPKTTAKIMSLSDPTKKMSKSDLSGGSVGVLDTRDEIIKKIKRAVTDSDSVVCYGEGKDGINNLLNIYRAFSGKTEQEAVKEFEGVGYGVFKEAVGECVADSLKGLQDKFKMYMDDKVFLDELMKKNAEIAYSDARKTLSKVYRKVGFYQP
jgi:tryptophanyl-tRNA synthetase